MAGMLTAEELEADSSGFEAGAAPEATPVAEAAPVSEEGVDPVITQARDAAGKFLPKDGETAPAEPSTKTVPDNFGLPLSVFLTISMPEALSPYKSRCAVLDY